MLFLLLLVSNLSSAQTQFWQQTNGPLGGRINCFALGSDGSILGGTELSGVVRSTDDGNSWNRTGLTNTGVSSVASRGQKIVAAASGIRLSNNMGSDWIHAGRSDQSRGLHITSEGHIFITTDSPCQFCKGIARTTDDGTTWLARYFIFNSLVTGVASASDSVVIAGALSGIWRSTDYGESWARISSFRVQSISVFDDIFFAPVTGGVYRGVYKSTDLGLTWTYISDGVPINSSSYSLTINSTGYIVVSAGNLLFRSTDNGTTWQPAGQLAGEIYPVALTNNNTIIAAADNLVFRTTDNGTSWYEAVNGLVCTVVSSSIISTNGDYYAATLSNGIFRSTNHGSDWQKPSAQVPSPYGEYRLCAGRNNSVFVSNVHDVYRTSDDGESWTRLNIMGPDTLLTDIATNRLGHLFVGSYGVGRSTDNGTTWSRLLTNRVVSHISINQSSGYLYVGTTYPYTVFRSTDNGEYWEEVLTPDTEIEFLQSAEDGTVLVKTLNNTLYRSTDSGGAWTVSTSQFYVSALVSDGQNSLYAGTDSGLLISHNGGLTWNEANSGLFNSFISSLSIDSSGFLVAGTSGGVYRSVQSITSVPERSPLDAFYLAQNYPNPWNPATTIRYGLPHSSFVTLSIYNTLGQQVAQLVHEHQQEGYHEVRLDSDALASGIYFYRMHAGGYVESKKMVVLH